MERQNLEYPNLRVLFLAKTYGKIDDSDNSTDFILRSFQKSGTYFNFYKFKPRLFWVLNFLYRLTDGHKSSVTLVSQIVLCRQNLAYNITA